MKTTLLWAGILAITISSRAAEFPPTVIPAGMGINIHFTKGHAQDLDLITTGGFKMVRMDLKWADIERKRGIYNWWNYDKLTADLEQRGLRPVYILVYSNPLYEETRTITNKHKIETVTASPQHPESIAAFARWAGAAATHFRGHPIIWEIWNEPNGNFWKPKANAQQYTALALATVKSIRTADPQATIIAPGSFQFPWTFFETLFASGILNDLDAVSIHPYRDAPPETALDDYLKLRALIARCAPPGKCNLPILCGEWGYSTQNKGTPLATQAAYLPRQQLANLSAGIPLSIWYDWQNDGPDPNYNEHNFGIMTRDLKPKPSYLAAQTLARELSGYRVACRLGTTSTNDWVLLCLASNSAQKLVSWTLSPPHAITLAAATAPITLELDAAPKYHSVTPPDPRLALAAAWQAAPQSDAPVDITSKSNAVIRLHVRNPLAEPVTARFTAEGFDANKEELVFDLPAKGQAEGELSGRFQHRDRDVLPVQVKAEFHLKTEALNEATAKSVSRRVYFMNANPLYLTLAPAENGLRAELENPSRTSFKGTLHFGPHQFPATLPRGTSRLSLDLGPNDAIHATLTDERDTIVASADAPRFSTLPIPRFRAILDGDTNIQASATVTLTAAPEPNAPYSNVFKFDYSFDSGWRFARCTPDLPERSLITGRPQAFGLWIYGDSSGNRLSARVTDSSGQTFQISGTEIDWTGWRWVTFPLGELKQADHWSGANDGKIHGNLYWDCPLLLDSNKHQANGTLFFAGLTLLN